MDSPAIGNLHRLDEIVGALSSAFELQRRRSVGAELPELQEPLFQIRAERAGLTLQEVATSRGGFPIR